jgi:hypothetical protein
VNGEFYRVRKGENSKGDPKRRLPGLGGPESLSDRSVEAGRDGSIHEFSRHSPGRRVKSGSKVHKKENRSPAQGTEQSRFPVPSKDQRFEWMTK